jgi:hypothetical protein
MLQHHPPAPPITSYKPQIVPVTLVLIKDDSDERTMVMSIITSHTRLHLSNRAWNLRRKAVRSWRIIVIYSQQSCCRNLLHHRFKPSSTDRQKVSASYESSRGSATQIYACHCFHIIDHRPRMLHRSLTWVLTSLRAQLISTHVRSVKRNSRSLQGTFKATDPVRFKWKGQKTVA